MVFELKLAHKQCIETEVVTKREMNEEERFMQKAEIMWLYWVLSNIWVESLKKIIKNSLHIVC